jgi:hypothetical protein
LDVFDNIPRLRIEVDCDLDVMVFLIVPSHFVLALSRSSHHSATYVNAQLRRMASCGAQGQETINDDKDYYGLNNDDFSQSVRSRHPEPVALPCVA